MELNKEEIEELKILIFNKLEYFNSKVDGLYFKTLEHPNDKYAHKHYEELSRRRDLFSDLYKKLLNYKGELKK